MLHFGGKHICIYIKKKKKKKNMEWRASSRNDCHVRLYEALWKNNYALFEPFSFSNVYYKLENTRPFREATLQFEDFFSSQNALFFSKKLVFLEGNAFCLRKAGIM